MSATKKEAIPLSSTGYIQVSAFTSTAQIPLKDVAVIITDSNQNAIAMRLTNSSGQFDRPIALTVPERSASLSPDTNIVPYTLINIYARKENFEEIFVQNVQVFPGTLTNQNLQLIPLAEFPGKWNKGETFDTPPQNL